MIGYFPHNAKHPAIMAGCSARRPSSLHGEPGLAGVFIGAVFGWGADAVVEVGLVADLLKVDAVVDVVFEVEGWAAADAGAVPVEWGPAVFNLDGVAAFGGGEAVGADGVHHAIFCTIPHFHSLAGAAGHFRNEKIGAAVDAASSCVLIVPGTVTVAVGRHVVFLHEPAHLIRHVAWQGWRWGVGCWSVDGHAGGVAVPGKAAAQSFGDRANRQHGAPANDLRRGVVIAADAVHGEHGTANGAANDSAIFADGGAACVVVPGDSGAHGLGGSAQRQVGAPV